MNKVRRTHGFTQINWDDMIKIRKAPIVCEIDEKKKKLSYSDILIIAYVKGFGDRGYFGIQEELSKIIGMKQSHLCRSINILRSVRNKINNADLFQWGYPYLVFNPSFCDFHSEE